jgi:hypothetical protein
LGLRVSASLASWAFLKQPRAAFVYFQAVQVPYARTLIVFPAVVTGYYLVWRHIIGYFNRVLEIA